MNRLLAYVLLFLMCSVAALAQIKPSPWDPPAKVLPGTPDPASLVGEWSQSHMSTVDFVSPSGGHADPSGERYTVHFFPDGTYKIGYLHQVAPYNCTTTIFGYSTGTYAVRGTDLDMQGKASSLKSSDNCHREYNYEKQLDPGHTVYQWHMATTKYGPALVLRTPSGEDRVYMREKESLLSEK